jgi:hypothetical protein
MYSIQMPLPLQVFFTSKHEIAGKITRCSTCSGRACRTEDKAGLQPANEMYSIQMPFPLQVFFINKHEMACK